MPRNDVIMSNLQKLELLTEYKWNQKSGDKVSLLDLADWAKEKVLITKTSQQPSYFEEKLKEFSKIWTITNQKMKCEIEF